MRHRIERLELIYSAVDILRERHLLIVAPAGYGKSVLLKQLPAYLPGAAYLRLTVDDNDVAILQQRLRAADAQTVLLDDVHLLAPTSESARWLTTALERLHPRLVLAARHLPFACTLPLVQDQAVRWDETDLAFSPEAVAHLLQDEQAARWHQRLGGWPLGIGLLCQLPPEQRREVAVQGELFDYLARVVFDRLPPELQRFLRLTAVPLEYSLELATHLLDGAGEEIAAQLETVQRRNLFLSEGSQPGTYRYHDLFREFLQAQGTAAEQQQIASKTITFLLENGDYAQAVEQALDSNLHERAAALLLDLKWDYLHDTYRYRTYDRWVMSLDPAVRDAHPALYWMAGHCLIYLPDREQEAFAYFERSEALALEAEDRTTVYAARYEHAHLRYMLHGASSELAEQLAKIARHAPPGQRSGLRARRTLSALQAELGHFRQAQATWHAAYRQAQELGLNEMSLEMMRRQYALYMLTPLGAYAQAREIFASTIEHTASSPGNQLEVLVNYCDLLLPLGAWDEMEGTRQRIDALAAQVDDVADYLRVWLCFYDGMLALARGKLRQAEAHFSAMTGDGEPGLEKLCQRAGYICLARQTGELQRIEGWLLEIDGQKENTPYHAAWAYLEADIARGLAAVEAGREYRVSTQTLALYHFRARGDLLRLRALLTVLCYEQGQPRWQRMARITLRELQQPHYEQLLTQRDPELGAQFWRVLLVNGLASEQAISALVQCGVIEPLLPLLAHPAPHVRAQSAQILAGIGDEQAMTALNEAIAKEKDKLTQAALEEAVAQLEMQPPPPLHIELLGGFCVRRGEQLIDDFHRPIVARLLQYFAVHRGRPLARDLILEALWPGTEPDKAWRTFRTVYSRLRNTLEPHMRSKGPNRYFSLDGDSYTFDPHGYVTVDVEQFRQAVAAGLRREQPLQQQAELLQRYRPVLPELGSVDWLLELRTQMEELYQTACLRLGEQLLARGDAAAAQQWAQRVIDAAPWMESAYQLLMRAYARQNLRSHALRTYEEACAALQAELAVDPSPLTEWLYTRLQAGESI